ncbi:MAG: DUF5615 family PIN-like protein [Thermomicrobiales bacterium]|nr:DUF5615 family PIN-like protein [Thermomicrobiales bacterium]MCO5218243.1 DUF5615 family PIN-like protein [Thermomicrobiales bacterium]MCO5224933.1 DUF5615 family PIN-like protein [Thermomicrobiales bacterium]MCO5227740.1 DUF5615 family PIN-like protein [Thermomicrobiales bacterium]
MPSQQPFIYLLDENLPTSVGRMLARLGRKTVDSRSVAPGAKDEVLVQLASEQGWVVITQDRDIKLRTRVSDVEEILEYAPSIRVVAPKDQTLSFAVLEVALNRIEVLISFVEERRYPIRIIRVKEGSINLELATEMLIAS